MEKSYLIETANLLPKFSVKIAKEYEDKLDEMINTLNQRMLKRADITELVGDQNIEMMKDNHSNHAHFIASILKNFNAEILVDTILWVFRAYRSRKFQTNYWAAQLNTWRNVINENLSNETAKTVLELYNWMQINIPSFTEISENKLEKMNSKTISH